MTALYGQQDSDNLDMRALEALVVEDPELEQLEALVAPFNIFEAIGVVRQEVRHSDFLAFLFDPSQNHGLSDSVLKRFLQRAVRGSGGSTGISAVELDLLDLAAAEVRREWRDIDVLVLDEQNRLWSQL